VQCCEDWEQLVDLQSVKKKITAQWGGDNSDDPEIGRDDGQFQDRNYHGQFQDRS
jgi:hypothetical protein